jgi:multiple sugar transport system substrate-binding protein
VGRNRLAAALAMTAATAIALAGCSGGSVTGNANSSGAGAVPITFWYNYSGANAKTMLSLVDEFNSSQTKYKVTAQYATTSDQFDAKLLNALQNGTAPNMVLGDSTAQAVGQIVETGKIVQLDPLLDDPSSTIHKTNFTPGLLSTGTFDGKIYTLTVDAGDYAVIYNKKMFQDAGLTTTPTTWAELADYAKRLTKGTRQYGIYLPIGTGEWPVFTWQAMLWSAGGEFLDASNTNVKFNSPEGVQALTAWTDMVRNGSAYPQSLSTPSDKNGTGALTSGKVAMQINGAYNLNVLDQALGAENVGVFTLPPIKKKAMNLGATVSYILKGTKEQEQASWEFLQWWLKPSTQAKWDIKTGYLPTNSETAKDPDWKAFLEKNPRIATFADQMPYAQARPSIVKYAQVSDALSQEINKAMLLQKSPSDALEAASKNAQAALASK